MPATATAPNERCWFLFCSWLVWGSLLWSFTSRFQNPRTSEKADRKARRTRHAAPFPGNHFDASRRRPYVEWSDRWFCFLQHVSVSHHIRASKSSSRRLCVLEGKSHLPLAREPKL